MLVGLSAALGAAVLFGSASIVQARAVRRVPVSGLSFTLIRLLLRTPLFDLAIVLNLMGFSFHFVAVRSIPLFLAQCGIATSLAVTALLAVVVLHDKLRLSDWAAVAAVCAGIALLASASGDVGTEHAGPLFLTGLVAAVACVAVLGLLASRRRGAAGIEALGLLAGFGFAGVGVSARVIPSLAPADLATEPAVYTLAASGALAFTLYSLALQRGSVTGATAPMIVSQTVVPALVGVTLLGDAVRPGWVPVAIGAFILTGMGAMALARFESSPTHVAHPDPDLKSRPA